MSSSQVPPKQSGKRREFAPSFKHESVQLALSIGFRQASERLDVSEGNLRNWSTAIALHGDQAFVRASDRKSAEVDLAAENRRLLAENRTLKMERDILKKATAFFAKDV